jgi:hypothetical protein
MNRQWWFFLGVLKQLLDAYLEARRVKRDSSDSNSA